MSAAEERLSGWLAPFVNLFTRPSWRRVVVLVTGALLTPHRIVPTGVVEIRDWGGHRGSFGQA